MSSESRHSCSRMTSSVGPSPATQPVRSASPSRPRELASDRSYSFARPLAIAESKIHGWRRKSERSLPSFKRMVFIPVLSREPRNRTSIREGREGLAKDAKKTLKDFFVREHGAPLRVVSARESLHLF